MKLPEGYHIGSLCKREHRYKRRKKTLRNKNGDCVVCLKRRDALKYKKHKKKIRKRMAIYFEKNKKQIRKQKHKWYQKNKKKLKEENRIYYENNKEAIIKRRLIHYHKNKVLKKGNAK
jgi:hypothetical protein